MPLDLTLADVQVLQGDCRELSRELPDDCAQLVLTDPPYNLGIPYPDYEDRLPWERYWDMAHQVLTECKRILRPGGVLAALLPFTAQEMADGPPGHNRKRVERRRVGPPVPMLAYWIALTQDAGLLYEDVIAVIHAWNGEGEGTAIGTAIGGSSRPRMRTVARALLVCFNESAAVPGRSGKWGWGAGDLPILEACKNAWYVRPAWGSGVGHPTPMPALAAARAIRLWSNEGDLVVDPFCGSGVVLQEARNAGRRAVGIDISRTSCGISERRLSQQVMCFTGDA
ncbi:MAG: site-specific DNA-methyltransferase [Chloroflexi bacterium]|nr:site-specific DNA-methyltransferase [Chloroflexota bacterium]